MADILRITTPLVNKNQPTPGKQPIDPANAFNLQDLSKVVKSNPQSELLKQNNGMIQKEDAPSILMSLLKDPSVTVNFLKNIFMLQEIIKLLPANNRAMTQELEQLFDSLLIAPEDITGEILRQQNTSTAFKGELFDFLRKLVTENPQAEIKNGVAMLLKSINGVTGRQDVLDAVANSLTFLSESMESSKALSEQLADLARQFRGGDVDARFQTLKKEVLGLLEEVEGSILFTPKLAKVAAMMTYNLSRFNDNPDFLRETISNLLTQMDGKAEKAAFLKMIAPFLSEESYKRAAEDDSKIMDVLVKIIGKQTGDPAITLLNAEKIEKIIHSLLSSPCNFTPLLHFVIPVQFMEIRSFAELWINQNGEEDEREGASGNKSIHMLIVFDIEGIGQFEAELYVSGETIDLNLFCPPDYMQAFAGVPDKIKKSTADSSYRFGSIRVDKLERSRSLMEVFKSLPYKRTGVDVKV